MFLLPGRRCNDAASGFQLFALVDDVPWDLRAFVGYAPVLGAKVVAFRGTDSHSWCACSRPPPPPNPPFSPPSASCCSEVFGGCQEPGCSSPSLSCCS